MILVKAAEVLETHLRNSILFTSPLKPNGLLLTGSRLDNSKKEDVVINTLFADNASVQTGVLNVNAYAPNLELSFNGVTDRSQPNKKRLVEIATLINDALQEFWVEGHTTFEKMTDGGFIQDDNNQWYVNFKVKYQSLNIKEN